MIPHAPTQNPATRDAVLTTSDLLGTIVARLRDRAAFPPGFVMRHVEQTAGAILMRIAEEAALAGDKDLSRRVAEAHADEEIGPDTAPYNEAFDEQLGALLPELLKLWGGW